ncbi:MAG: hypothetical protein ACLT76_18430 [Clostridium fessum]
MQFRELVAADYGAPTMRKRFFLIARCDAQADRMGATYLRTGRQPGSKSWLLKPYVGRIHSWIFHSHVRVSSIAPKKLKKVRNPGGASAGEEDNGSHCPWNQKFILDNPEPLLIQCNQRRRT